MDAERLTVPALLRRHSSTTPDLQFVVTEDAALTYGEAERASNRLAARLVRAGIGKGTRVGLLMPNGCEWALTAIAVMQSGQTLIVTAAAVGVIACLIASISFVLNLHSSDNPRTNYESR